MAVYVLPKFRDLYTSLDANLPLPTRMLLGFTNFMANWWWLVALLLAAARARARSRVLGGDRGQGPCATVCCCASRWSAT